MPMTTYVVAGTHREFLDHCQKTGRNPNSREYRYVANAESLRGLHGVQVECIGTWQQRADRAEIDAAILLATQRW